MKPEPLKSEIDKIFREEEDKYILLGYKKKRTSIDTFNLLDRIQERIFKLLDKKVDWLLREIEKYVDEIQKHKLTTASEWKIADIMRKDVEDLIKKAFEEVRK